MKESKGEVSKASRGAHWEVFLPFQPTRESASRFDKSTVYFGFLLFSVSLNRWKRNLPVLGGALGVCEGSYLPCASEPREP